MESKKFLRLVYLKEFLKLVKTSFQRPSVIALELTNRCNAQCVMCPRDDISRKRENMDFELFKHAVDSSIKAGVFVFQLSYFGEPTLYPRLAEAVQYIKSKSPDAWVQLNTNAARLDEKTARNLLNSGISSIRISIEGNNKLEYNRIRVGLDFEQLEANVKRLREIIDDMNSACTIVVQGLNIKGVPLIEDEYKAYWGKYAHQVGVRNDREMVSLEKESLLHKVIPCPKLFSHLIIMADGNVTICGQDWGGFEAFNDINVNSVKNIWFSKKIVYYRLLHLFGLKKLIPICSTCRYRVKSLGI